VAHTTTRPRLHFVRRGDGEPLLWITGFTISAAIFDPVLHHYTDRFACVTYDNRGSGRSATPLRPTSMPELAADAVRVLDAAGVPSAHVYGLSMGGMIAQELAIRFPERVRGLVLGATTPGGPQAFRPALRELRAMGAGALGALREPGRPWLGAMVFSPRFRREHPDEARALLRFFAAHRARPHGMAAHWWASVYHDTISRLHRIQAPTLVLHGGADAMAPLANARLLADRIPDSELAVVPGAGHAYLLEDPERSTELLTGWLDRRGPIGPGVAHTGLGARVEPLTRALGLPIGALRTGRSLVGLAAGGRAARRTFHHDHEESHVAPDRRAA
jgi:pimeloyl-ACP methyl ester carboxylesterase